MPITVHFTEENEDWLSKKETKKDKKKPVKPEGKPKKAPKNTKTAAENLFLAHRVAQRYQQELADRFAKATLSLLPDLAEAVKALEKDDTSLVTALGKKIEAIILPEGGSKPAEWFWALGVSKRNAIKDLLKSIRVFEMEKDLFTKSDIYRSIYIGRVKGWAKDIRTLELNALPDVAVKEFAHGPFTVVPMEGVTKASLKSSLEALDAAVSYLQGTFPEVLYGKVYLTGHLRKNVVAWYLETEDKFYINTKIKTSLSDVYVIIHELGHRYDKKFLDSGLRKEFWDLSTRKVMEKVTFDEDLRQKMADEALTLTVARMTGRPLPPMSPQLVMWLRWADIDAKGLSTKLITYSITNEEFHKGIKGKKDETFMTEKVLHGPLSVTPYGATKPTENFAESFAHYVLRKDQPQELASIIERAKK